MKDGIHPHYVDTTVRCGCGNTFTTRSTVPELKVDICNLCHPFFTGKLKFIDTAGRIEKFKNKFAGAGYASLSRKKGKAAEELEAALQDRLDKAPQFRTLKDMLNKKNGQLREMRELLRGYGWVDPDES